MFELFFKNISFFLGLIKFRGRIRQSQKEKEEEKAQEKFFRFQLIFRIF